jgi:hypothetical protein
MILRRLVLAVLLPAAPAAYAADDGPYLFALLKQPASVLAVKDGRRPGLYARLGVQGA